MQPCRHVVLELLVEWTAGMKGDLMHLEINSASSKRQGVERRGDFRRQAAAEVLRQRQPQHFSAQRHVAGGRVDGSLDAQLPEQVSPCQAFEVQQSFFAWLDAQVHVAEDRHAEIRIQSRLIPAMR